MLVLIRKKHEAVKIGEARVRVLRVGAKRVMLGIEAPPEVQIYREEAGPRPPRTDPQEERDEIRAA